jgi:type I restriction enzyme R subunit
MELNSYVQAGTSRMNPLNPTPPPKAITAAVDELTCDRSLTSLEEANREVYLLLREGIKVSVPPTGG